MTRYNGLFAFAVGGGLLLASTAYAGPTVTAAVTTTETVQAAIQYPGRPPNDRDADATLKPSETIPFLGLKPGQIVTDFIPGSGYYTRIFSRVVGPKGHVYSFVPVLGELMSERRQQMQDTKAGANPPLIPIDIILGIENIFEYSQNVSALWAQLTQYGGQFPLPVQTDAVWNFGSYHELHTPKFPTMKVDAVDKAIFRAMKPGGVFVIADNAAAKGDGFSKAQSLERSESDTVKAELLSAGFLFDGENKALANAADDHTKKASDPSLQGKPDRFMMRFKKPMSATGDKRPPASEMKNYYGNTYVYNLGEKDERHHFYYPDGRYQEFGNSGDGMLQEGYFYWDADGHNCQLHQYPIPQRSLVVCHSFIARQLDVVGQQDNGYDPPRGLHPTKIMPGYHALPH